MPFFLLSNIYFETTALISGFQNNIENENLINSLSKNKKSKKLAAMLLANSREIDNKLYEGFINNIIRNISNSARLPEKVFSIVALAIFFMLFILAQIVSYNNMNIVLINTINSFISDYLKNISNPLLILLFFSFLLYFIDKLLSKLVNKEKIKNNSPEWLLILSSFPILFLIFSNTISNISYFYILLALIGIFPLFMQFISTILSPLVSFANKLLENYYLNVNLLPNLLVAKVLNNNQDLKNEIEKVKAEISSKSYISQNIKTKILDIKLSATKSTELIKTAIKNKSYNFEDIKTIEDYVNNTEIPVNEKRELVDLLKKEVENMRNQTKVENIELIYTILGVLINIAVVKNEFRFDIINFLRPIPNWSGNMNIKIRAHLYKLLVDINLPYYDIKKPNLFAEKIQNLISNLSL